MATIHDLVQIKPEVLEGNLHGIVSLFSVVSDDPDEFEKDPARVFAATYPSEALRRLLSRIRLSIGDKDAERKGNFVISGGYGSGKSHLLLTLYHILRSPDEAAAWLADHDIDFVPPEDATVLLLPMNQLTKPDGTSIDYLWEPIFAGLGYDRFEHTGNNFPTATHIEEAVAGRRVFLIIDEIERWFMPIKDKHQAEANISFLQNLCEFGEDASNGIINLFTLLLLDPQIQTTIFRQDPFREDLTQAPDRRQIVLYRLVEGFDRDKAAQVVDAYLEQYKPIASHVSIDTPGTYRKEMLTCYPFHPATIETVFERYSSVARLQETSYQNSRGALFLLSHVLRQTVPSDAPDCGLLADADLIRVGDVSLTNRQLCDDLQALNPRLVEIARTNVRSSEAVEHAADVLSVVLLHSLGDPQAEKRLGAELGDILLGVVRPPSCPAGGITANQVQACLVKLDDTALNLHREENPPRWVLKPEINVQAQINRRARTEAIIRKAPEEIVQAVHDVLSGPVVVYPHEPIPDARDITIVVSTKHLDRDEILQSIYHGKSFPNGLVIVMPRGQGSLMDDTDLLWMAQTKLAAEQIQRELAGAGDIPRLVRQKATNEELVKAIPTRYGKWMAPVYDDSTNELHFRGIDVRLDRTAIMHEVETRYDASRFERAVLDAVERRGDTPPTVDDIRADFYRQRSYPKPVAGNRASDGRTDEAIRQLVHKWQLQIVRGGDAHVDWGTAPVTLDKSWMVRRASGPPPVPIPETVLEYLRPKGETGAKVQDVRAHCHHVANQREQAIQDSAIDDVIVDLIREGKLQAPSVHGTPTMPLAAELFVCVPKRPVVGKTFVQIGPLAPQAAKTKIIQDINKTDRLSDVRLEVRQELTGKAVAEQHEPILGVKPTHVSDKTQLEVTWQITDVSVSTRDGLKDLLDALPSAGDVKVTVRLSKESPKGEGDDA